jgi:hypothetical protein
MRYALIFLTLYNACFAQKKANPRLDSLSQSIHDAYFAMWGTPDSLAAQRKYVKQFPSDYQTFAKVFDPPDFGYLYRSCFDYIDVFHTISNNFPHEVCKKLVSLSKDGELYLKQSAFIADAPALLQQTTIQVGVNHPDQFLDVVHQLSGNQKKDLATFLADVESFSAYSEYQSLLDTLSNRRESRLLELFLEAKQARMMFRHHGE